MNHAFEYIPRALYGVMSTELIWSNVIKAYLSNNVAIIGTLVVWVEDASYSIVSGDEAFSQ